MTVELIQTEAGLYNDKETGQRISTNSMMKTFRRCPKQAEFKYARRLKPKMLSKPLKRGVWIHRLLELYHMGLDWQLEHLKFSTQFGRLFDEEKEYYGDLPTEILLMMEAYIWHYKLDTWKVHETEITLEAVFPDGTLFRGKADALVENDYGLWIVDHKSHKVLPDFDYQLLDTQSALYVWAAKRSKIPVQGFIWNYLRWKPPAVPVLLKNGQRLSKVMGDTDYPTYVKTIKRYHNDPEVDFRITEEHKAKARQLKALQYQPGRPQDSPMFRRVVLERDGDILTRVAAEQYRTSQRMHEYDFLAPGVERHVDARSCKYMCSYTDLCTADLMGGNVNLLIRQNYDVGDPNDYYQDRFGDSERDQS